MLWRAFKNHARAYGLRHSFVLWGQMNCFNGSQKLFRGIRKLPWATYVHYLVNSGTHVQQANWRARSDGHRFHNLPCGARELCEARSGFENIASNYPVIEPIDATSCVVLQSHFWLCKASDPKGRNVGTATIACSPSIDSMKTCLPFKWRVPSRYNCQFHYLPFELMSLRSQKWLRKMMQLAASIYQQSN